MVRIMGIPARAILVAELHCMAHDGGVRTVQHWTDPRAPAAIWSRSVPGVRSAHPFRPASRGEVRESRPGWEATPPAEDTRSWVRLVCNGRVAQNKQFVGSAAHQRLSELWSHQRDLFAPTALDEDQMWAKLHEVADKTPINCPAAGCGVILPVAWNVCPAPGCRRSVGRVSSGSLSGVRLNPLYLGRSDAPGNS